MVDLKTQNSWRRTIESLAVDPRLWFGLIVTIAAVWLFVTAPNDPPALKSVYVASSIALAVAGMPQAIAALVEHSREAGSRRERELAALDETRRVCLMALSIGTAGERRSEVIATFINAAAYHSAIMTPAEAAELMAQLYTGGEQKERIQALVNELCARRGDSPMYPQST